MKILSVTVTIPQDDAQWVRISNIARILEKRGLDISIVHYIIKGGESHRKLENLSDDDSIIINNPLLLLFNHLRILKKGEYDLVYGNTFAATFFCVVGKFMKKPLISDMHGISEEYVMNSHSKIIIFIMKLMERIALLFSDKILCVSHEMVKYLHNEKRVPMKKLFYVPNGVDLDFFNQINENQINKLKKKYKIEDKLIFGYLGGTQKWQGLENFIVASRELDSNFVSIIVGADVADYQQVGNIIYIPKVTKNEIIEYYSLCDVLVLPRPKHIVTEVAAPTKFAEYVSMGKPVLVTDVGDAAKLVRKYENGIVLKDNGVENLKEGINDFLKLGKDKLNQMGVNSRKLAEKEFDWDNISNSLMEIIGS